MSIAHLSRLAAALLGLLREMSPGAPFRASHRALAAALDCSAGNLPRLMRELEEAGLIACQPYKNTRIIQLIDQPAPTDRSVIDQPDEAPAPTDRSLIDHFRRSAGRAHQDAAQRPPRPITPSCARASSDQEEEVYLDPDTLLLNPESQIPAREQLTATLAGQGCADSVIAAILAACPALTPAEYAEQLGCLPPGKGPEYLWGALRRGRRLQPPRAAPDADRAIDPAALTYGDHYRRGDDLEGLDPAALRYLRRGVTHAA